MNVPPECPLRRILRADVYAPMWAGVITNYGVAMPLVRMHFMVEGGACAALAYMWPDDVPEDMPGEDDPVPGGVVISGYVRGVCTVAPTYSLTTENNFTTASWTHTNLSFWQLLYLPNP